MSKVITVLEKMASDAAMNSEAAIAELVSTSDINDGQQQAINANDVDGLVKSTNDLPKVDCFLIIPAEDEEQEQQDEKESESTNQIQRLINF